SDDWAKVFAINLYGAFHAAQAALPAMQAAGGGAFVFISSVAAFCSSSHLCGPKQCQIGAGTN
ncbi:MAG: SDR family NAD(P)-dependent oxidoreductase, partial [Pseudomonadota bacterium]